MLPGVPTIHQLQSGCEQLVFINTVATFDTTGKKNKKKESRLCVNLKHLTFYPALVFFVVFFKEHSSPTKS